jgi:hypothetical protein
MVRGHRQQREPAAAPHPRGQGRYDDYASQVPYDLSPPNSRRGVPESTAKSAARVAREVLLQRFRGFAFAAQECGVRVERRSILYAPRRCLRSSGGGGKWRSGFA